MLKDGLNLKVDASEISIILANILPIFGLIFWNWSLFSVLILYWLESAVIGFYTIAKMVVSSAVPSMPIVMPTKQANVKIGGIPMIGEKDIFFSLFFKLFLIPFFCIHFGGFMLGHLMFILVISSSSSIFLLTNGLFDFSAIAGSISSVLIALAGLFISHGVSFYTNFIKKEEYKKTNIMAVMFSPYPRIIVMQLTIIFGGFILMLTRMPAYTIGLFVIIKTLIDLKAHRSEHKKFMPFSTINLKTKQSGR